HIHIETEVLDNDLYKQKLKVLSTSNEQPDIGFSWSAGFLEPYISGQRFAPLNDLLNHELKDMFIEGTTEPFSMNGNTYALPFELHLVPIYYNKAIFEKYDLTPPETLDDFKAIITVLNEFDVTPIGLGGKDPWTSSFWYMYLADRIGGPKLLDEAVSGNNFQHPDLIKAAAAI